MPPSHGPRSSSSGTARRTGTSSDGPRDAATCRSTPPAGRRRTGTAKSWRGCCAAADSTRVRWSGTSRRFRGHAETMQRVCAAFAGPLPELRGRSAAGWRSRSAHSRGCCMTNCRRRWRSRRVRAAAITGTSAAGRRELRRRRSAHQRIRADAATSGGGGCAWRHCAGAAGADRAGAARRRHQLVAAAGRVLEFTPAA